MSPRLVGSPLRTKDHAIRDHYWYYDQRFKKSVDQETCQYRIARKTSRQHVNICTRAMDPRIVRSDTRSNVSKPLSQQYIQRNVSFRTSDRGERLCSSTN